MLHLNTLSRLNLEKRNYISRSSYKLKETNDSMLKPFLKLFPYFKMIFYVLVSLMTHEIK